MGATEIPRKRLIAYIDGFNLYFGMKDTGWQRYYWLDICRLIEQISPLDAAVVEVKYFTARVASPEAKRKRQATYLEALEHATSCRIIYGNYVMETEFCTSCYSQYYVSKEKMTDVNIAVEMMRDAYEDRFDIAMLISGDSDLTPPVVAIRQLFPNKKVVVRFPPKRSSNELRQSASDNSVITRVNLRDSQLSDEITKPDGYVLARPPKWR